MKKSLLALAVLGAFAGAAHAQSSSITIYGAIDASLTYTNKIATDGKKTGSLTAVESGLVKGSRLGVKGSEDLGGGLKAVFTLENGFNVDTGKAGQGELMWGRQTTVGLSGNFGTVLIGRQNDPLNDIGGIASAGGFGVPGSVHSKGLDRTDGQRVNNSIRYNSPNFNGLSFSGIYGFGEQTGKAGGGRSFGLGGQYVNGPLSLGLGYFQSKMGGAKGVPSDVNGDAACNGADNTNKDGDTCLKTWTLAGAYQFGPAKVYGAFSHMKLPLAKQYSKVPKFNKFAAMYNPDTGSGYKPTDSSAFSIGGTNHQSSQTFDIGASYQLMPSLALMSSVQHTRARFVGASSGRLLQFNLGAKYDLSKRTSAYALVRNLRSSDMYNVGLSKDQEPGIDRSQTAISTGLIHTF
ncbi:porin [Herbaspirillum seropedicae]|uniref:porin n=1 Tax=Herbaspirillum seropedicae TaxID=964 RepID=UPI000847F0D8|nr:porin [Herbaspirillum seropedicae]AON53223.1 porin signal peptide protein [Herbaspirillum seropedicae]